MPSDLERVFTAEADGVRVRFELQRNPLPAGEVSWVKIAVTNIGRTDLTWAHDGCASIGSVSGESGMAWRMGERQSGTLASFKAYALGGPVVQGNPWRFAKFGFVPEDRLGKGSYGCADMLIQETIEPGETLRSTRWWSGFSHSTNALPITGPALLTARSCCYWRGEAPERLTDSLHFEIDISAWIDSPDKTQWRSPAEIVDAALTDDVFANYVAYWQGKVQVEEVALYQAARGVWEVGLLNPNEPGPLLLRGVEVDPIGGWVIGPLARPWDPELDGYR